MTRRFTPEDIRRIREMGKLYSYHFIAGIYHCSDEEISGICTYRLYKDVDPKSIGDIEAPKRKERRKRGDDAR